MGWRSHDGSRCVQTRRATNLADSGLRNALIKIVGYHTTWPGRFVAERDRLALMVPLFDGGLVQRYAPCGWRYAMLVVSTRPAFVRT
jgi:hypothetical protein